MAPSNQFLSLRKDITLLERSNGKLAVQGNQINFVFNPLPSGVLSALKQLSIFGATEQELADIVVQEQGINAIPYLYLCIQQLSKLKILCRSIRHQDFPLITLIPISSHHQYHASKVASDTPYVLSRFAYCRQNDTQIVLESPLAHEQLILHSWQALALWGELKVPRTSYELSQTIPEISVELVQSFLDLFINAKVVTEARTESEKDSDNDNLALVQWEFHDLLFHSRSRLGRHINPYGGTYRFLDKIEPLPIVKAVDAANTIPLFRPNIEHLQAQDLSFTQVLEQRHSIREQGEIPLTLEQLGEFLFRVARVKSIFQTENGEFTSRPYPSGGALYELEIYLFVQSCTDLVSGIYHYCPQNHYLNQLSELNQDAQLLLEQAWYTIQKQCHPQVLLVISARFPRVNWKYQSMAYALILKHVGVLYQTMYLVATAMGLAPCALGGGDSDLFAKAVGLDYYTETSVGEFILGSKPNG